MSETVGPHSVEVLGFVNIHEHKYTYTNYIAFTKFGNVEQELPLQNGSLYTSGFSGETGRPRFFVFLTVFFLPSSNSA